MDTTRNDRRRAFRILHQAYAHLLDRVTSDVLEKEAEGRAGPFDFAWEDLEGRHASRLQHLGVMLQALEGSTRRPTRSRRWAESFPVEAEEALDAEVNRCLETKGKDGVEVEAVQVVPRASGGYRVLLLLRQTEPAEA